MYVISSRVFWSIGMFAVIGGALLLYRMNLIRKRQYPQLVEEYVNLSRYIFLGLVLVFVLGFVLMDSPALTIERRPVVVYEEGDGAEVEVVGQAEELQGGLAGYFRSLLVSPSVEMTQATLQDGVLSVQFSVVEGPDEMLALSTTQFYVRGAFDGTASPQSNTAAQIGAGEVARITFPVNVNALAPPLQLVYTFKNHTYTTPIMVMDTP